MIFTSKKLPEGIDSLIGPGTRVEGNVIFRGRLRLDGSVHGNVSALPEQPGMLIVGEKGRIDGEVSVPSLDVNGTINGPMIGFGTLEFRARARVSGDLYYKCIVVRQGAIVEGRLANGTNVESKQAATLPLVSSG